MDSSVVVLILVVVAATWWYNGRHASELAKQWGGHACTKANVQFLDQTVSLLSLRLRRDDDGRMRVYRQYRFEYSYAGADRHSAQLSMLGGRLLWISEIDSPSPRST
ncbi:MAG: hypothetical protein BWZ07_02503 [Alphaproteobacteria bacterium ADurb.BinA280]|jgi:hypothetical protein|nr:MAG: hypothetical protein BWZ07_02503 [Alphaproteobacteria bacterium ADurb.BinA280]